MTIGFKKGNKFIPTSSKGTTRKKRFSESSSYKKQIQKNQTMHSEGIRLKRYKKFVPRVTIKANKNRGEKQVANYTVNLAGRGMYVVGSKKDAEERAEDMRETVRGHINRGHGFTKDGYVIYPERKS